MEMRAALAEKEDQKSMKQKMRERVRPKMGKIDIDYQKLHDAFFKWQTKPKMTIHGDLYYEVGLFFLYGSGLRRNHNVRSMSIPVFSAHPIFFMTLH